MPAEQTGANQETIEEENVEDHSGSANTASTNTTKYVIPYSPESVITLKLTVEFELRPAAEQLRASSRATEPGTFGEKEADRTFNPTDSAQGQVGARATEPGTFGEKEADRTYTPPRE